MKTSLQFNVRTWNSAATGRWPFRYSNWWLSFIRSLLVRSRAHSPSRAQCLSLFVSLSYEREPHTAFAYLHAYTYIQTYIFFLTFMIVCITKSLRFVARLSKIYNILILAYLVIVAAEYVRVLLLSHSCCWKSYSHRGTRRNMKTKYISF